MFIVDYMILIFMAKHMQNLIEDNVTKISFPMGYVKSMAMIDIQDFFNNIFNRRKFTVKIIDSKKLIVVSVKNSDKKMLTIKEKYDSIISTEG